MTQSLHLGCAGWSISSAVSSAFPEKGTHLQRYAAVFSAVEINSSFYRPHRPNTYARWRDSVPDSFRFSVKIPREITHIRRLRDARDPLDRFLSEVSHLKDKLGCLLLQLPPSLAFSQIDATEFMNLLRDRFGGNIVCEPRHASWTGEEAIALLHTFSMALVIADPVVIPHKDIPDTDTVYLRLHGSPEMYKSSYPDDTLLSIAERLADRARTTSNVWCVFDNTMDGAAIRNALTLRRLWEKIPHRHG
jgi:uncharacterized protein YecE (DUF72 family)